VTAKETGDPCVLSGGRRTPSGAAILSVSRHIRAKVGSVAGIALLLLFGHGLAEAQDAEQAIHSHSLRAPSPQPEVDIERQFHDLYAITEEEGVGYFEELERRRQRRAFLGHYRKATLRRLRDWSLDLFPGEWPTEESSAISGGTDGPTSAGVGGSGWAAEFVDHVINETDVELRYGGEESLTFSLGRDLDLHGPDWLRGSRVEFNPITGEMEVDFDLRTTSVTCGVSTAGGASISWSIPF